jgi:hypothetical protein
MSPEQRLVIAAELQEAYGLPEAEGFRAIDLSDRMFKAAMEAIAVVAGEEENQTNTAAFFLFFAQMAEEAKFRVFIAKILLERDVQ